MSNRRISYIVVHCTAGSQKQTIESIKSYWKNTLKWKNVGYHRIIKPDGEIVKLAEDNEVTNGVAGYNSTSIHISYIGGIDANGKAIDNRTTEQKCALEHILKEYKKKYPNAVIKGHRDFSIDKNKNGKIDSWERIKECPCFDAIPEYSHIK